MSIQRVNLLHAGLLPAKVHLSFAQMMFGWAALCLVLILYSSVSVIDLMSLSSEQERLADQVQNLRAVGDRMRAQGIEEESDVLRSEVDALQAVSEAQAKIATLFTQRDVEQKPEGFAEHFRELAQHTVDGVWLTQISLNADNATARIHGRALSAVHVPTFIQALAKGERFDGYRFSVFELTAAGDGPLQFSIIGPQEDPQDG